MSYLNALIMPLEKRAADAGWDWSLKVDVASECMWGAELRVTPEPNNPNGPDRSIVYFAVAGESADEVAAQAINAALDDKALTTEPSA